MNTNVYETILLPSLFRQFGEVLRHNQRVITEMTWKSRGKNSWNPMSDAPPPGSFPTTFKAVLRMPMFLSPSYIDPDWHAVVKVSLSREYVVNTDGNGAFDCTARFSRDPFHHHAVGEGPDSRICLGNLGSAARQGKLGNLFPLIAALLNRDESACAKGGHLNREAFEHWRALGYASISPIGMFGPDGNLINGMNNRNIPFRRA